MEPEFGAKIGHKVLLRVQDGESGERREAIVEPITPEEEAELRYDAWEHERRLRVETLGRGEIGYVHLRAMGADVSVDSGYIRARASRLKGVRLVLDIVTVTGTENLMMAATLAKGTTILENAAREQDNVDLANALLGMGAKIEGAGADTIIVEGVDDLKPMDYRVMPDRIEAGTFLVAAAMTGGRIGVKGGRAEHLDALLSKLEEVGATIEAGASSLWVQGPKELRSVNIKTQPHPGFPTDMQAQFMAMMSLANGTSMITEAVFENRFMHVCELQRMGADISIEGHTATVKGVDSLLDIHTIAALTCMRE